MTSVKKKDMEHGQEHGEIQNLGSPILSKIQQAFLYIRTLASGTAHEEFSSYRSIQGNFRPGQLPMLAFSGSAASVCCRESMWGCASCLEPGRSQARAVCQSESHSALCCQEHVCCRCCSVHSKLLQRLCDFFDTLVHKSLNLLSLPCRSLILT